MSLAVAILGSTGSVGQAALRVASAHPDRVRVVGLGAYGSRLDLLEAQVQDHRPSLVAVADPAAAGDLASRVGPGVLVKSGAESLSELASDPGVDRVVAAMVGAAGLLPVAAALGAGKGVALANKESLVVAGGLLMELSRKNGAPVIPVDSEHVALHQALRSGTREEVRRLVLTASGGPFLERDPGTWHRIRREEALKHPNWEMGDKISIDSATLVNKGLELIEASHLFGFSPEEISVVVHPQSLVHSLVEFRDGSVLAQLAANDMALAVQYALGYPDRWEACGPRLDLESMGTLEFYPLDGERFPAVEMARSCLAEGESAPAVMNAANEVAVKSFLEGTIPFSLLVPVVGDVLSEHRACPISSLEEALQWDAWGRSRAAEKVAARARAL